MRVVEIIIVFQFMRNKGQSIIVVNVMTVKENDIKYLYGDMPKMERLNPRIAVMLVLS